MSDMAPEFLTVGTGEAARRIAVRVRQGAVHRSSGSADSAPT